MASRPSWDEVWMLIARDMGERSACIRRRIGAVVVAPGNRIVATGYNGPPAGYPETCLSSCPRQLYADSSRSYRNCISIHAEANALMFCDRREREGGTIYVLECPCWDCAKLISNSGLHRVVIWTLKDQAHRDPESSLRMLRHSGLEVVVASSE